MIVAETDEHVRFVTQPAHAELAGQFAERWGNDCFERPEPATAMTIAATHHDAGWWAYDLRPHFQDGRLVDFRSMPPDVWIDLYETGIDAVVDVDAYAGLVVSLHGAGLRRRRYGLSPSWPDTPPAYAGFVDRQEAAQTRLRDDLRADGRLPAAGADCLTHLHRSGAVPDGHESRLWTNYKRLQAWDTLSLALCMAGPPSRASEIRAVPTGTGRADETLSLDPIGDGEFWLSPYPFDDAPLIVSVPARTVEQSSFDDEQSLLRAYYGAEREHREMALRRAD